MSEVTDGDQLILNKVRGGDAHGGGQVFTSTSAEYQALSTFLSELTGTNNNEEVGTDVTKKLTFDNARTTLRRTTILMAGRLPTEAEYANAETSNAALRETIKGSLQGEGFHEFLVRSANNRLLTDSFLNGGNLDVIDPNSPQYPVLADLHVQHSLDNDGDMTEFYRWYNGFKYGVSRAPLELIAYIAENDLPYTQILTADYTMVNPISALIYNANVIFSDNNDLTEFVPAHNRGQILLDNDYNGEFVVNVGSVIESHGDYVSYPHAGILNEPAFLNRYPTTDTNRNRARSRWVNFHFLDVDIEKSAPRTNDPEALADTNNPTMNNSNCSVCHQIMDPIAGTFQNYGDEGYYRNSWGGLDALPSTYKWEEDSPYMHGDTWYRDMRTPGFNGKTAPSNSNSLQWLSQQIIADERFARASVKFWWPAVMSEALARAPEDSSDANYQAKLLNFELQSAFVEELANGFRSGFNGGKPYNLKDLLVELVLSDWFRANGVSSELLHDEHIVLEGAGKARLLGPEELESKTRKLVGFAWGESFGNPWAADGHWSMMQDSFMVYYGGIDSLGVTERADALNSLMSNVALAHAIAMACPSVLFDFNRPRSERLLFKYVDRTHSPNADNETMLKQQLQFLHWHLLGEALALSDTELQASYDLLVELWQERQDRRFPKNAISWEDEVCEIPIQGWWDEDRSSEFSDPEYMQGAWMSMMVYFMTDYHYLHE